QESWSKKALGAPEASNQLSGSPELLAERVCAASKFNFFIVRILVNNPRLAEAEILDLAASSDFSEFFDKLFDRMMRGCTRGVNFRATYALCLRASLLRRTFQRLMRAQPNASDLEEAETEIDSWILQGILDVTVERGLQRVYPFHETFKKYLDESFTTEQRLSFLDDFRERVIGTASDGKLSTVFRDVEPRVTEELLSTSMSILIASRAYDDLHRLLLDLEVWQLASETDAGVEILSQPLANINPQEGTLPKLIALYKAVGLALWRWTDAGEISFDGRRATMSEVRHLISGDSSSRHAQAPEHQFGFYFEDEKTMEEKILEEFQRLMSDQKSFRMNNDFEKALIKMEKAQDFLRALPDHAFRERSRFFYDRAYLERSVGNYKEASLSFRVSGEVVQDRDNGLRSIIGRYMAMMTDFYGGNLEPEPAFEQNQAFKLELEQLSEISQIDRGLFRNFRFSMLKTLADFAFEIGHPNYLAFSRDCQNDESMKGTTSSTGNWAFRLNKLELTSREPMHAGDYQLAAEIFSTFIVPEAVDDPSVLDGSADSDFLRFVATWLQQMAREYRDYARCVVRGGGDDAVATAKRIYHAGLSLPDGCSNLRFKRDISRDLEALG
ncbi:MAG: hypothetical protein AAGG47_22525, partial [Pseudomonadota bacterium]